MLEAVLGLPYGNYVLAVLIFALSVIAAKVSIFLFQRIVLHVTSKTKTKFDDAILHAITKPVYFGIILAGFYFAVYYLNVPPEFINPMHRAFVIVAVVLGAFTVTRVIRAFLAWYTSEMNSRTAAKLDETMIPVIRKITSVFIYGAALLIILRIMDIEITPLLAGLGIGGLAIALALQDSLSNLFAGTFMVSDRMIKVGSFIQLDTGVTGYVDEIGWRSTRIRTRQNNVVVVPNSKLANSIVTDFSSPQDEMSLIIPVGVSYASDLEKVEKVTLEVAKEIQKLPGAKNDFTPTMQYASFGDSNINFEVTLRITRFDQQYDIIHEFVKALKKRYDNEKIEISYPVRKIIN